MDQTQRCSRHDGSLTPDFGQALPHRSAPCTPRELFCRLLASVEDNVHYLEPAFLFVTDALDRAPLPALELEREPAALVDALITWSLASLGSALPAEAGTAGLEHIVREFAPVGLSDGAWLSGSMLANAVESETGMRLLRQLMTRFGDPGSREGYARRYAALLRSLAIAPGTVTDEESGAPDPVSAQAYEHALLGLTLGLFPTTLPGETLGFNLWMAAVGPCPLLERMRAPLVQRGACVRYLDLHDRATLAGLAKEAAVCALAEADSVQLRLGIARGVAAAQASYLRWESAVLETSAAGSQARSLGARAVGKYAPPQDPQSVYVFALQNYGPLSMNDLYYRLANVDRHPLVRVFARVFVSGVLAKLSHAFAQDERLHSREPPLYSERTAAGIVADQHLKNVRSRENWKDEHTSTEAFGEAADDIHAIFDGCWLQGFADVSRADLEEYGWLFRIYASEHGDGDLSWNHCQIFRRAYAELGSDVMLPKADPRLYGLFRINVSAAAKLAVSLNTHHFLPEILGMNLGIEATGVGGDYMERWKRARRERSEWKELAYRLHNSIDNYADGHTKWSLAAVQAYLKRVGDADPSQVQAHWHRIWRLWRFQDLASHGSAGEREALRQHFEVTSLAPM